MAKPFFAYILLCADGAYYVGHTDDLEKRVWEHEQGGKCAYTSARRPVSLAWFQDFNAREDAKEAELKIKKWSRAKKDALIRGDYHGISLAGKKDWEEHKGRRELRARE